MDDLTASVLSLLIVSPSIAVLYVLVARRIQDAWKAGVLSARAKLQGAMKRKVQFQGKLCCQRS